jgi:hypothetical protein
MARSGHVLLGIFASRQPKPFGVFLTHSGHFGGTHSSTTRRSTSERYTRQDRGTVGLLRISGQLVE